jgi:hypothetical protein
MMARGQTGRGGKIPHHLKAIVIELHRFKSLHGLLAATALLATALLQEVLKVGKIIVTIGQLHYVHVGSC